MESIGGRTSEVEHRVAKIWGRVEVKEGRAAKLARWTREVSTVTPPGRHGLSKLALAAFATDISRHAAKASAFVERDG
jgi:hypothetical protein